VTDEPLRPLPIYFGDPDPGDVVGRHELLEEIRRHLARRTSVLLVAGRRRGKASSSSAPSRS